MSNAIYDFNMNLLSKIKHFISDKKITDRQDAINQVKDEFSLTKDEAKEMIGYVELMA